MKTTKTGAHSLTKTKDIIGQEKDEKDEKMLSHLPRLFDLFLGSIYYLL